MKNANDTLRKQGYIVLMPALKGKRRQLTIVEANDSRKITKVGWVIEAIHEQIGQKYHLLHRQVANKILPRICSYTRIACFLQNQFGKRLNSDIELRDEILAEMISRQAEKTRYHLKLIKGRWGRRKVPFKRLTSAEISDFSEMTQKDLIILFNGSYQLHQAVSYLAEIMDANDNLVVYYLRKKNIYILKLDVKSRHINKKAHKCFIEDTPDSTCYLGVRRYCCKCANRDRTVGC